MIARIRTFIHALRKKNEREKRVWVFGASAVTMALVVVLWVVYLNITLPEMTPVLPSSEEQKTAERTAQTDSTWNTFKRGIGIISGDAGTKWRSLSERIMRDIGSITDTFNRQNEISVEATTTQFTPTEPQEAIPPTKLP
jgi:hypothetical protein